MEKLSSDQLCRMLAGNCCEALLEVMPQVWTRCGKHPVEVHHRLPRSRGGLLLDAVGENYHLLALCRDHHKHAHESNDAFYTGMMLAGRVLTQDDRPVYDGPDRFLRGRYGPVAVQVVPEALPGAEHGKRMREET